MELLNNGCKLQQPKGKRYLNQTATMKTIHAPAKNLADCFAKDNVAAMHAGLVTVIFYRENEKWNEN